MPDPTAPSRVRRVTVDLGPQDGVVDWTGEIALDDGKRADIARLLDTPAAVDVPPVVAPAVDPTPPTPVPAPAPLPTIPPPPGATPVRIGSPLPAMAGANLALERGGAWTILPANLGVDTRISAFGDPAKPRPVLTATVGSLLAFFGVFGVRLSGIALRGQSHTDPVLRFFGCTDCIVSDCEIIGGSFGITAEAQPQKGKPAIRGNSLQILNCDFHDLWQATGGDASAVYLAEQDGAVLTGNIVDRVGYNPNGKPGPNIRSHGFYIQGLCGPANVRENLFVHTSAEACQARSGGNVQRNLFVKCPISIQFGLVDGEGPVHKGGVSGSVRDNVVVGSSPIGANIRGYGLLIANVKDAQVTGNLFAGDADSRSPVVDLTRCRGVHGADDVGLQNLVIAKNRAWGWGAGVKTEVDTSRVAQSQNLWNGTGPDLAKIIGADPAADVRGGRTTVAKLVDACFVAAGA
jgi:hypothetical protein